MGGQLVRRPGNSSARARAGCVRTAYAGGAMDWQFVLLDGAVGALAGALGWFFTRNAKEPIGRRTQVIRIATVVVGIVGGQQFLTPIAKDWKMRRDLHAAALDLYGNEESAALHTQLLLPIIKSPRFEARIKKLRSAAADSKVKLKGNATGVADLIGLGMARLDIRDLAEIFDVKCALAEKSPALCAGFWTGQLSNDDLKAGMRTLSKEQQTVWITVSGRALSKEVAADGPPPPEPATKAGTEAMDALLLALPPDQQAAFAKAAQQAAPNREVACNAFRALAAGLEKIPVAKRDVILHLLSAAPTGAKP